MKKTLFKLFSSVAIAQGLVFLATPFLANLYGPAQFGEFGVFFTVSSICGVIFIGRLDVAINKSKSPSEVKSILGLSVVFGLAVLTLLVVTYLTASLFFKFPFNLAELIFGSIAYGAFLQSNALLIFKNNFNALAHQKIVRSLMTLTFQFSLVVASWFNGLIMGTVLSYLILAAVYSYEHFKISLNDVTRGAKIALKRHKNILRFNLSNELVSMVSHSLPLLLIMTFNIEIAGVYFLAERLIRTPLYLVSSTIRPIIIRKLVYFDSLDKKVLYRKYLSKLFLLSICIALIYKVTALYIFKYFTFVEWPNLSFYLDIVMIIGLCNLINTPTNAYLTQINQSHYLLVYEFIFFILKLIPSSLYFLGNIEFEQFIVYFSGISVIGYLSLIAFVSTKSMRFSQKEKIVGS